MSDLFMGELLVLILLLPPILRPFFAYLRRISGIAALPLVSLILCAAIMSGDRFRLSFAPTLLFTLLVFLVTFPRLYRLSTGLPSDWFGAGMLAVHGLLALLFAVASWASYAYSPETAWSAGTRLESRDFTVELPGGRRAVVTELYAVRGPQGRAGVLLFGEASNGGRTTVAQTLAEAGYRVYDSRFVSRGALVAPYTAFSPVAALDLVRRIAALRGLIAPVPVESQSMETYYRDYRSLALELRRELGPSVPFFALAEGAATDAAVRIMGSGESPFGALACLVPSSALSPAFDQAKPYALLDGIDSFMPAAAKTASTLAIVGGESDLFGFGELSADDPLAAALAGGARDTGRKRAELVARRVEAWFSQRRAL